MIDRKKIQIRLSDLATSFQALLVLYAKDKTKLTRADKTRIRNIEQDLELIMEPEPRSLLTVDVQTIASFFGVTVRQVQNWVSQKGCPKLKHGLYDLRSVHQWHLDAIIGIDNTESVEAKSKYWIHKAEREKVQVETLKGKLIPREEVFPTWTSRTAEVSRMLAALSKRLPPLLEGKDRSAMQAVVDREITRIKENFCREGKFCGESPE